MQKTRTRIGLLTEALYTNKSRPLFVGACPAASFVRLKEQLEIGRVGYIAVPLCQDQPASACFFVLADRSFTAPPQPALSEALGQAGRTARQIKANEVVGFLFPWVHSEHAGCPILSETFAVLNRG